MTATLESLHTYLSEKLHDKATATLTPQGELTVEVQVRNWLDVCNFMRHDEMTKFTLLIDLCGVDYLTYGHSEWSENASSTGFSRAVERSEPDPFAFENEPLPAEMEGKRFAVVIHLLSVERNQRIRLRTFAEDNDFPVVPSVFGIWNSVNWYEREAFDLFGIMFPGHPDLRRILTDYGFVGHPFRKDFPLIGQVEMRYDPLQKRVIYEPVSIEPRVLVPRVIRNDKDNASTSQQGAQ